MSGSFTLNGLFCEGTVFLAGFKGDKAYRNRRKDPLKKKKERFPFVKLSPSTDTETETHTHRHTGTSKGMNLSHRKSVMGFSISGTQVTAVRV